MTDVNQLERIRVLNAFRSLKRDCLLKTFKEKLQKVFNVLVRAEFFGGFEDEDEPKFEVVDFF